MLNIPVRPITTWPGTENKDPKRSQFKAGYRNTINLLDDELTKAKAVEGSWFVEMWVEPGDLRLDGQLRANAKVRKQGIIFRYSRFTSRRVKGTDGGIRHETQDVSYPCDAFDDWQDNLRAIALSMESLRRVERYGVFKYDEIISRLALPSAEGSVGTRESAAEFLEKHSAIPAKEILFSETARAAAYRKAAFTTHPDRGGNPETFQKVVEANSVLTGAI